MGAGKTTIASRIGDEFGCEVVSTAQLLEDNKQLESEGKTVADYVESGELVPDTVVNEVIDTALAKRSPDTGVVIDGFPRTSTQAAFLSENDNLQRMVFLDLPVETSRKRIKSRKVCLECKSSYHPEVRPPEEEGICDRCGGSLAESHPFLYQVENSFERTGTIKDRYEECDFFTVVDATRPPNSVWQEIERIIIEDFY
jgi:adenylate kinase